MMKGRKTGGRDFKPGQSGNPAGRTKLPDDLRSARKLNLVAVNRILNKFMSLSAMEIQAELDLPDTPALELMLGKIILEAAKNGDHMRLSFLLDRLIGKVSDKIEHKLPEPTVMKVYGEDALVIMGSMKKEEEEE